MCARLTTGDLPGDYESRPLTVAYISAEDDSARILKPRFQAAGADDHRYYLLTAGGVFSFAELKALDPRPDVVVFDPISRSSICAQDRTSTAKSPSARPSPPTMTWPSPKASPW